MNRNRVMSTIHQSISIDHNNEDEKSSQYSCRAKRRPRLKSNHSFHLFEHHNNSLKSMTSEFLSRSLDMEQKSRILRASKVTFSIIVLSQIILLIPNLTNVVSAVESSPLSTASNKTQFSQQVQQLPNLPQSQTNLVNQNILLNLVKSSFSQQQNDSNTFSTANSRAATSMQKFRPGKVLFSVIPSRFSMSDRMQIISVNYQLGSKDLEHNLETVNLTNSDFSPSIFALLSIKHKWNNPTKQDTDN